MARSPSNKNGAASGAFNKTTPAAFRSAGGNPTSIKALSRIEDRAAQIKVRAIDHFKAFQDRWTAKEAIRIWQQRVDQHAQHPGPDGSAPHTTPEEVLKLAGQVVRARTVRRLSKINAIKTRMTNAVARNLETPRLKQTFERTASNAPKQQLRRKP